MDLKQHLIRQMAFSHATFGPGQRTDGVIAHIKKELAEVREANGESSEWVDVVILALDGLTRRLAYATDDGERKDPDTVAQMACNMIRGKQTRNEARSWPDWRNYREGEAIEHVPETVHENVFEKGQIIRYGKGPTALMRIDSISLDHGGPGQHRYYGAHCLGGLHSCYHSDAKLPTERDVRTWQKNA